MEHGSRTRLLTALVLAVVFGAGVLLGLAADSSLRAETAEVVAAETSGEAEPERRRRALTYPEVDPTPEQQTRIDAIVSEHRERTNALDKENRVALRGGFRAILLETREAIKGVFTPEQAAEYQRLLDERDARAAAEREDRDDRNRRDGRK